MEMSPLQEFATLVGGLVSTGLAVAAYLKSSRAGRLAAEQRNSEIGAQVQARYEDERGELLDQLKAFHQQQLEAWRERYAELERNYRAAVARIEALEQRLRDHNLF